MGSLFLGRIFGNGFDTNVGGDHIWGESGSEQDSITGFSVEIKPHSRNHYEVNVNPSFSSSEDNGDENDNHSDDDLSSCSFSEQPTISFSEDNVEENEENHLSGQSWSSDGSTVPEHPESVLDWLGVH